MTSPSASSDIRSPSRADADDAAGRDGPIERPDAPYVGMRPFERHEQSIYFGREKDARFLCDKIPAESLTVFYARSGLGKSSLVRARVGPALEALGARMTYFDAWAGSDPISGLKQVWIELAVRLGVPSPGAGAPTLAELVRLVAQVDARPIVLVLDQFEQFMLNHADAVDPLRRELSALVRAADLDVHVVIVLREEFLASLEPFRSSTFNVWRSTYRLEPMDDDAVRRAIVAPAGVFHTTWDDALVKDLLRDLRGTKASAEGIVDAAHVDLPLLQLVCQRLWQASRRRGMNEVSRALYRDEGGVEGILRGYVSDVMPRRRRERIVTARLITFLAPASGLKMSYSAAHLASLTGFDAGRIRAILDELAKVRVLHVRAYRGVPCFELQHDALTSILGPWAERILALARRRSRIARGVIAVLASWLLLVAIGMWRRSIDTAESRARWDAGACLEPAALDGVTDEEKSERFDTVATHWFSRRDDGHRFDELRNVLRRHERELPEGYGIASSGWWTTTDPGEKWPLTIAYPPDRALGAEYFRPWWYEHSLMLARSWGIPVPTAVHLSPEDVLSKDYMEVRAGSPEAPIRHVCRLSTHAHEVAVFPGPSGLDADLQEFFEVIQSDPIPQAGRDARLNVLPVPRWSLPAFKAKGFQALEASGLTAFGLFNELLAHPEALFTAEAIDVLEKRLVEWCPTTCSEARRVRGDMLRTDLIEIVRTGRPITNLKRIYDNIASYPRDISSAELASEMSLSLPDPTRAWTDKSNLLEGARVSDSAAVSSARVAEVAIALAYREAESWLPRIDRPVRVKYGAQLRSELRAGARMNTAVISGFDSLRDRIYRRYGVVVAAPLFECTESDDRGMRVEWTNTEAAPATDSADSEPGHAWETAERLLADFYLRALPYWVDADSVQASADSFAPGLRAWLEKTYSTTDLKRLGRRVLGPGIERAVWTTSESPVLDPDGGTIRDLEWLFGSLVFWSNVVDRLDASTLAARLREVQAARTRSPSVADVDAQVAALVARGVDALAEDRVVDAEQAFRLAVQRDRGAAIAQFLRSWPAHTADRHRARLAAAVTANGARPFGWMDRVDLYDWLEGSGADQDAETLRRYRLCVVTKCTDLPPEHRQRLIMRLLKESGEPDAWPATDAATAAQQALALFDPLRPDQVLLDRATDFLASAVRRMDDVEARREFAAIAEHTRTREAANWAWDVMRRLAEIKATDPRSSLALDYADWLLTRLDQASLHHALDAVDGWRQQAIVDDSDESGMLLRETAERIRASAQWQLVGVGERQDLAAAEQSLRALTRSKNAQIRDDAVSALVQLLLVSERAEAAARLLEEVQGSANALFEQLSVYVALQRGEPDEVAAAAARLLSRDDRDPWSAFAAALGQIVVQADGWENTARRFIISGGHEYRPYIAMQMFAFSHGDADAREVLERLWRETEAGRSMWSDRMRVGDQRVWSEKLVGYYLDKLSRDDVFGDIEDPARYAESPVRFMPQPREALLCESYFYDALHALAQGDQTRMRDDLQRVLATGFRLYLEYDLARYLLSAHHETR
ncbi:MAG: hypothetical protein U0572_15025 [Phycisphaerales bacterium]